MSPFLSSRDIPQPDLVYERLEAQRDLFEPVLEGIANELGKALTEQEKSIQTVTRRLNRVVNGMNAAALQELGPVVNALETVVTEQSIQNQATINQALEPATTTLPEGCERPDLLDTTPDCDGFWLVDQAVCGTSTSRGLSECRSLIGGVNVNNQLEAPDEGFYWFVVNGPFAENTCTIPAAECAPPPPPTLVDVYACNNPPPSFRCVPAGSPVPANSNLTPIAVGISLTEATAAYPNCDTALCAAPVPPPPNGSVCPPPIIQCPPIPACPAIPPCPVQPVSVTCAPGGGPGGLTIGALLAQLGPILPRDIVSWLQMVRMQAGDIQVQLQFPLFPTPSPTIVSQEIIQPITTLTQLPPPIIIPPAPPVMPPAPPEPLPVVIPTPPTPEPIVPFPSPVPLEIPPTIRPFRPDPADWQDAIPPNPAIGVIDTEFARVLGLEALATASTLALRFFGR
jgi:hypothetical protein